MEDNVNTFFSIIVAMDHNRVIGDKNKLPWHIPSDLRRFSKITTGHAVVMGRKTYESIINKLGKPLPNRHNIILTRQKCFVADRCSVIHTIKEIDKLNYSNVFIIGGAEVYNLFLPYTGRMYLTLVDVKVNGTAIFPDFDKNSWHLISREPFKQKEGDQYSSSFMEYERMYL